MLSCRCARMAELADAPDSKSGGRKAVWVRPPLRAPKSLIPNPNVGKNLRPFLRTHLHQKSASNMSFSASDVLWSRFAVARNYCYQLLPIMPKICYTMTHVDTSA